MLLTCLAAGVLLMANTRAGTDMKEITPPATGTADTKDWTLELGSGVAFSNVRTGFPNQAYTLIPATLCASLKVDDVSLDNFLGGVFRGNTEFFFRGDYDFIVRGPEHHYEGIFVGPRYNFVQPNWVVVPFIEGGVGVGWADCNPEGEGLGEHFNFSFEVATGLKYNLTKDVFMRLECQYQHVSNAGLSGTVPNNQIDALGPKLSVGFAF
jgi:opacity protein-like surface antigen